MSKAALVAGTFQSTAVVSFADFPWQKVKPTRFSGHNSAGGAFETINGGTEYFMSALQFGGISALANVDIELQFGL